MSSAAPAMDVARPRSSPSGASRPGLSFVSPAASSASAVAPAAAATSGAPAAAAAAAAAGSLSLSAADRALVDASRQRRQQGQQQRRASQEHYGQQSSGQAVAAARVREQQHAARVARAGAERPLHEALWSLGLGAEQGVPPLFAGAGMGEGITGGGTVAGSATAPSRPRTSHASSRATVGAAAGGSATSSPRRASSSSPLQRGALSDQRARSAIFEGHSQAWGDDSLKGSGGGGMHAEQKEWIGAAVAAAHLGHLHQHHLHQPHPQHHHHHHQHHHHPHSHFGMTTVPRVPSPPRSARMIDGASSGGGGGGSPASYSPASTSPYLSARRTQQQQQQPTLVATSATAAQAVSLLRSRLDGTVRSCGGSVRPLHSVAFAEGTSGGGSGDGGAFDIDTLVKDAVEVPLPSHGRLVRGALEVVAGLGAVLGPEGDTLARRVAAILAQAAFAPVSAMRQTQHTRAAARTGRHAPSDGADSGAHLTTTYRQAMQELQQRTLDAEEKLLHQHARPDDSDGEDGDPKSPSGKKRAAAGASPSAQPMISLSRFYRQLDLLTASFADSDRDALQDLVSDLRQQLFQASVAEKSWVADKAALTAQIASLQATALERERAHENAAIAAAANAAKAAAAASLASSSPVNGSGSAAASGGSGLGHPSYAGLRPAAMEDLPDFRAAILRAKQGTLRADSLAQQLATASRVADAQRKRAQAWTALERSHLDRQKALEQRLAALESEMAARLRPLTPRPEWHRFPLIDYNSSTAASAVQQRKQARELDALLAAQEQANEQQQQQQSDNRRSSSTSPVKFTREITTAAASIDAAPPMSSSSIDAQPPQQGDQVQAHTAEALAAVAGDIAAAGAGTSASSTASAASVAPAASLAKPVPVRRSAAGGGGVLSPPVVLSAPAVPSASAAALFASGNPVPGEMVKAFLPLGMDPLHPVSGLPREVAEVEGGDRPVSNFFPLPPGSEGVSFIQPFNKSGDGDERASSPQMQQAQSLEHSTSSRLWSLYLAYKDALAGRAGLQTRALKVVKSLQAELRDAREKLRLCEAFVTKDVLSAAERAGSNAAKLLAPDGQTPLTLISLDAEGNASTPATGAAAATAAAPSGSVSAAASAAAAAALTASMPKYFAGLGQGPDVPAYLRATGQVRNKMLSKKDVDALVRGLMNARAENLRESAAGTGTGVGAGGDLLVAPVSGLSSPALPPVTTSAAGTKISPTVASKDKYLPVAHLSDFLYVYLKRRLGSMQALIAEVGYSLLCALEKHRHRDASAAIVLAILRGDVHESAWQDSLQMQEGLRAMLARLDHACHQQQQTLNGHGQRTNIVPKMLVLYSLRAFFPTLSRAQLVAMARALNADQPGQNVNVAKLLLPPEATATMIITSSNAAAGGAQDGFSLGDNAAPAATDAPAASDGGPSTGRKSAGTGAPGGSGSGTGSGANASAASYVFLEHIRQEHLRELLELRRELQERCTKRAEIEGEGAQQNGDSGAPAASSSKDAAGANAAAGVLTVSLADVRDVWLQLDPHRSVADMEAAIAVALDLPSTFVSPSSSSSSPSPTAGAGGDASSAAFASSSSSSGSSSGGPSIVWNHRVAVGPFFRRLLGRVFLRKARFFDPAARPHLGIAQQQVIIQAANKAAAKVAAAMAAAAAGGGGGGGSASGSSSPMRRATLPSGGGLLLQQSLSPTHLQQQQQQQAVVLTGPRGQCLADLDSSDLLADAADAWLTPASGESVPAGHLKLQAAVNTAATAAYGQQQSSSANNSHPSWSVLLRGNGLLEPPLTPSSTMANMAAMMDDVAAVAAATGLVNGDSAGGGGGGSGSASVMPTRPPSASPTASPRFPSYQLPRRLVVDSANSSPILSAQRRILHNATGSAASSAAPSPRNGGRPSSSPFAFASSRVPASAAAGLQPHPPSARRA